MAKRRFSSHAHTSLRGGKRGAGKRSLPRKRPMRLEGLENRQLLAGLNLLAVQANDGTLVEDGQTRHEAPREVRLFFEGGASLDAATLANGIKITRSGGDGNFNDGDEAIINPGFIGLGDTNNVAIVRFAEPLPDDFYQLEIFGTGATPLRNVAGEALNGGVSDEQINFRLDLGAQVISVVPQPIIRNGAGALTQRLSEIFVYFNKDELDETKAETTTFYQLTDTKGTGDTSDDVTINPTQVIYNAANNSARLIFAAPLTNKLYRLRIGSPEPTVNTPAAPVVNDNNDSLLTATPVGTTGAFQQIINSQIEPQGVLMRPEPGGLDEPGHRQIPPEIHFGSSGGEAIAPSPITVDPETGNSLVVNYTFNKTNPYGSYQGTPFFNDITDSQMARAREILEIYGSLLGVQFREVPAGGLWIITGDLRAADPLLPVGVGGVAGVNSGNLVIMDAADYTEDFSPYGGGWFTTAFHEIGHALGLGHAYELPAIQGGALPGPVFPGDHDLVHLRRLHRPDANDVDLYKFTLQEPGRLSGEITAERLPTTSNLDSVLRLFDANGNLVAQNDDYHSNDAFLELDLEAGTYYLGVSSVGNTNYNPNVANTGGEGRTDGPYQLKLDFQPAAAAAQLMDLTGTALDGDADGRPGGAFEFWFEGNTPATTIYVDKARDLNGNQNEGSGTLADPYDTIDQALSVAGAQAAGGQRRTVRIVGNGGADGNLATTGDNRPYLIGRAGNPVADLPDGVNLYVPANVTVMVDAGAILKFKRARVDVGSSTDVPNRGEGAFQVLGTPTNNVYLTSFHNDALGGNSETTVGAVEETVQGGNWGGVIFREDAGYREDDRAGALPQAGIFLNSINQATITYGGGPSVGTGDIVSAIEMLNARPAVWFNMLANNLDAAISANPDSFDDRLGRIGPDIHGNILTNNSLNGLFVQIATTTDPVTGDAVLDQLEKSARFDDTDIVHIITENLTINGEPGGPFQDTARLDARLKIDPGITVKLQNARIEVDFGATLLAEGTAAEPIVFTSLKDDRYGHGDSFDTNNDGAAGQPAAGDWSGLVFRPNASGAIDHAQIGFGGGSTAAGGNFDVFSTIEVHQAHLRLTNSRVENNAAGQAGTTIYVLGAQPIVVNNIIQDNQGSALSINANALQERVVADPGRSTGRADAFTELGDNRGPLVRLNRLDNNALNGMEVRAEQITTQTIWDDTDIVHVLQNEIVANNYHTDTGIRLQSRETESLVVKLTGADAGFTANGAPLDISDRIGGTVQVVGRPGHPVVLTSLNDCSVGAGFTPRGLAQRETAPDACGAVTQPGTQAPYVDIIVVMDESASMGFAQTFSVGLIAGLDSALMASGIGNDPAVGLNQFGLVGYGGGDRSFFGDPNHETPHAHPLGASGGLFGTAAEYATAAAGLVTDGAIEDGYQAIQYALANYPLRPDAEKFILLVTNEDRDVEDASLSYTGILSALTAADVTLEGIVSANMRDGDGMRALALNNMNTAFLPDGSGGFTTNTGGTVTFASGTTQSDYIDMAFATGGIAGDIGQIQAGGVTATSFGVAMISSIVSQAGGGSNANAGDWRSIKFDRYSNDRNVAIVLEREKPYTDGVDQNAVTNDAQFLGQLAKDEKSGDESLRLGFQVEGFIALDDPTDVDVYSFEAQPGSEVWFDIDRTAFHLDTVLELVNGSGVVLARSLDGQFSGLAMDMIKDPLLGGDYYTSNRHDASQGIVYDEGFRAILPGNPAQRETYFVRVRSRPAPGQENNLDGGRTRGEYQLNIRLRQVDNVAASTVHHADIRFATNGVEVLGAPYHSPLLGESAEPPNDITTGASNANALALGNLLTSDRNVFSVAGGLSGVTDVDWYEFELGYDDIQAIGGVNGGGKSFAMMFDIDYADGLVRPDTILSVFDSAGRLILVGHDSNIADDQPAPGQGLDSDDLRRGSFGKLDPFIGTQQFPAATPGSTFTYYVAVSSNAQIPAQIDATLRGPTGTNILTRLEPINSIQRIVEDHIGFQGYTSGTPDGFSSITPVAGPMLDIKSEIELSNHVVPFSLGDVVLFAATGSRFRTINPFTGQVVTDIRPGGISAFGDIAMRPDGRLFAQTRPAAPNNANSGNYRELDTGTGAETNLGDDGINTDPNTGQSFDALTFRRLDTGVFQGFAANNFNANDTTSGATPPNPADLFNNPPSIWRIDPNTGAAADTNPNSPGPQASGPLPAARIGDITGLAFNALNGSRLYAADEGGNIWQTTVSGDGNSIGAWSLTMTVPGAVFTGLSLGPQNVHSEIYADLLFGSTSAGQLYLLDPDDSRAYPVQGSQIVEAEPNNAPTLVGAQNLELASWDVNPDPNIGAAAANTSRNLPHVSVNATGDDTLDYYRFVVPAGSGRVIVDIDGTSAGFDSFVRILNAAGTEITSNNDARFTDGQGGSTKNADSFLDLNLPAGTYYVEVGASSMATPIAPATPDVVPAGAAYTLHVSVANHATTDVAGTPVFSAGLNNSVGLAFSPLDFNLWHPTTRRGTDQGHGINEAFDLSRNPGDFEHNVNGRDLTEAQGGASFYFGFEEYNDNADQDYFRYESNGQLGVHRTRFHEALSSNPAIGDNYNLPGGALGALVTNPFSLEGYDDKDKPTLYFNYFLNTQDANSGGTGMRDSARVYVTSNGGETWSLVATNNSTLDAELSTYLTTSAAELGDPRQDVQELFETTGAQWRQARIDLAEFAGRKDLQLRFEFHTAGTFNQSLDGDAFGNFNSNTRGQQNNFEGFYVDDIIVGFAERGEMVTGAATGGTSFFNKYANGRTTPPTGSPEQSLAGPYQLEMRRGMEYISGMGGPGNTITMIAPETRIATLFDTNSRLVQGRSLIAGDGSTLTDGQVFLISDGVHTIEFEYNSAGGVGVGANGQGRIAVPFTAGDPADVVAASITAAINSVNTVFNGSSAQFPKLTPEFAVTASNTATSNRVELTDAIEATTVPFTPNLTVTVPTSTLSENGGAATGTVTREGDLSAPLTVTLQALDSTPQPYTFTDVAFQQHAAVVALANRVIDNEDDAPTEIPIGFNFTFFGSIYSTLFVSPNGLITFGSGNTEFSNNDLTTTVPQAAIAALWNDWVTDVNAADAVYAATLPDPAHPGFNKLVVRWEMVPPYGSPTEAATFEAVLYEFDSAIQFNYVDLLAGAGEDNGASSTVGVKNIGAQTPDRLVISLNDGTNPTLVGSNQSIRLNPPAEVASDELTVPVTVMIPAGAASATFPITAIDDALVDGSQAVLVRATATGYASVFSLVDVTDDETPTPPQGLAVAVSPFTISESAGPQAAVGTVARTGSLAAPLDVFLYSSDPSEASVPRIVTIPAGAASVQFDIAAVDEPVADLERRVTIFAAAPGFSSGRGLLEVAPTQNSLLTVFDRVGDRNVLREQGHIQIDNNFFSNNAAFGVFIDAGARGAGGNLPFPGAPRNTNVLNSNRLAPGVAVVNNVITDLGQGGIFYSGDPNTGNVPRAAVPMGRIVNNTIYGGTTPSGTGIQVTENASPTILNNILANLQTGISINTASVAPVANYNLFLNAPTPANGRGPNDFPPPAINGPLFVNPDINNFYPAPNVLAIDSSLNTFADALALGGFKTPLGIPQSLIRAPSVDVYGQQRIDIGGIDPTGGGSEVFKDRGAVERADVDRPYSVILNPQDNDAAGVDVDLGTTFVDLRDGLIERFRILLGDGIGPEFVFRGTGLDPTTVLSNTVRVRQDGRTLTPFVDYNFGYDANSGILELTPFSGLWNPNSLYTIDLNNRLEFTLNAPPAFGPLGVTDGQQFTIRDEQGANVTFEYESGYTLTVPRTLELTVSPLGGNPGGVADGEVFELSSDDGMTIVTFEFDSNPNPGSISDPNFIRVPFSQFGQPGGASTPDAVAQAIIDAIAASGLALSPKLLPGGVIHLGSNAQDQIVSIPPSLTQSGVAAGVEDGQYFTVRAPMAGGGSQILTFEFTTDGAPNIAGNLPIDILPDDTNLEIAAKTAAAINAQAASLGLTATDLLDGRVHLGGQGPAAGDPGHLLELSQTALTVTGQAGVTGNLVLRLPGGQVMRMPEEGGAIGGVTDGDTFTVNDGANTVVFEFDSNGVVNDLTAVPVLITASPLASDASELADAILAALATAPLTGLAPDRTMDGQGRVLVRLNGPAGTTLDTSGAPALAHLYTPGLIGDGENFTITRNGVATVFEFSNNPALNNPSAVRISFVNANDGPQILSAMRAAILGANLGLTPTIVDDVSLALDATAEYTVNTAGTKVNEEGVPGGAVPVVFLPSADVTEQQVARLLFDAINGASLLTGISTQLDDDRIIIEGATDVAGIELQRVAPIADLAGNPIRANRTDGSTVFTIVMPGVELDYGDAPDLSVSAGARFPTLLADNGARHAIIGSDPLRLGAAVDADADGQPSAGADADTSENGVTHTILNQFLDTQFTVNASGEGFLNAWIDWNQDGDWLDPGEHIFVDVALVADDNAGPDLVTRVPTLTPKPLGPTLARFRFSTVRGLAPTGLAEDGEVEDYVVNIIDGIPPVANDDMYTTNEDTLRTVLAVNGLLANDDDPDGGAMPNLIVIEVNGQQADVGQLITLPSGARLQVNADGSLTYNPRTSTTMRALALGEFADDTFTYRISDQSTVGGLPSAAVGTVTIRVNGQNDAPVARPNDYATDEETAVGGNLLTDDTGNGVDFDFDVNGTAPDDVLVVSKINGQDVTMATGNTFTLPPVAPSTVGAQVTVDEDGTFSFDPTGAFDFLAESQVFNTTFTYTIADPNGGEDTATVTITLTGLNDAPTASEVLLTVSEDGPAEDGTLGGDDVDSDDDPSTLTYTILTLPSAGVVTDNGDGTFTFDPDGDFEDLALGESREVTFTYRVTDQHGLLSNIATVRITVQGENDDPNARRNSYTTTEDTTVGGMVIVDPDLIDGQDDDPDSSDILTVSQVNGENLTMPTGNVFVLPSGATVTMNDSGAFIYDPRTSASLQSLPEGSSGQDFFTYTLDDGQGGQDTATVTLTVMGVNDPPVARFNAYATDEDTAVIGNVITDDTTSGVDTDPDQGDVLTVVAVNGITTDVGVPVTLSTGARVTIASDGALTYDPAGAFDDLIDGAPASEMFTYTISDGRAMSVSTVSIAISGLNDRPTADPVTASAEEDGPVVPITLSGDDADSDDDPTTITFAIDAQPSEGAAIDNGDGTFSFDPGDDFQDLSAGVSRDVTFTYIAIDQHGAESDPATVTVTVTGVNDDPTARPNTYATDDNSTATGNVITDDTGAGQGPDSDPDSSDILSVSAVNGDPAAVGNNFVLPSGATVRIDSDGSMIYDPSTSAALNGLQMGETGQDTFTYTVDDGQGGTSTSTVSLTITGVNDDPIARPNSYTTDDNTPVTGNVITDDTDGAANVEDPDSDADLGDTTTVAAVNGDATVVGDDVVLPSGATLRVNADGTFTYDPTTSAAFNALIVGETDQDSFTYTIEDTRGGVSTATVSLTINGANDAPTANPTTAEAVEDGPAVPLTFSGDDADSDDDATTITFAIDTQPAAGNGMVENVGGVFQYNPGADLQDLAMGETRQVTFTYVAIDQHGLAGPPATVTVTVTGVNDAPVANNQDVTAFEDGGTVSTAFAGDDVDSDDDQTTLQYTLLTQPSEGTAIDNGDGTFTFDPGAEFQDLRTGQSRTVTFTYRARDSHGVDSVTNGTVTVTVMGTNEPPIAANDSGTTIRNIAVTVNLANNDSDVDPMGANGGLDLGSIQIVTGPVNGAVQVNVDGTVLYTPRADFAGSDTFTYQIRDNEGALSNVATVSMRILNPPNAWQNPARSLDVNADGLVSVLDALLVVNDIRDNLQVTGSNVHDLNNPDHIQVSPFRPPYIDPTGEGLVNAADILAIVTFLRSQIQANAAGPEGEGESERNAAPQALAFDPLSGKAPTTGAAAGEEEQGQAADSTFKGLAEDSQPPVTVIARQDRDALKGEGEANDEEDLDDLLTTIAADVAGRWSEA